MSMPVCVRVFEIENLIECILLFSYAGEEGRDANDIGD